jgi:hypothetical protein
MRGVIWEYYGKWGIRVKSGIVPDFIPRVAQAPAPLLWGALDGGFWHIPCHRKTNPTVKTLERITRLYGRELNISMLLSRCMKRIFWHV